MISSIISAYDQPNLTFAHVKGSMSGSVIPDEIIVVNDGGDKSIVDKLRTVEKKTKLIYARINEDIPWNTNGAYNLGIFISRGDVLSIEDCDHIPYPDFYEKALLELSRGFDRVIGLKRQFITLVELSKPMSEWQPYKNAGSHSLVGLYTRNILLKMKGYDERFGGHYGWNGADILRRLTKLGCKSSATSGFYMVSDGMSMKDTRPMIGSKAKMEKENYWQLRRNYKEGGQVEHSILNFTYTVEIL